MKQSEQRWPAQQAPDDFAERVVQAALLGARANLAAREPSNRAAIGVLGIFRRAGVGGSLAAALAAGVFALYFGKIRPDVAAQTEMERSRLIEAHEAVTSMAREVSELRGKVAALEVKLQQERSRNELSPKMAPTQHAPAAVSEPASPGASASPRATPRPWTSSRPPCNCQPGDALCACL